MLHLTSGDVLPADGLLQARTGTGKCPEAIAGLALVATVKDEDFDFLSRISSLAASDTALCRVVLSALDERWRGILPTREPFASTIARLPRGLPPAGKIGAAPAAAGILRYCCQKRVDVHCGASFAATRSPSQATTAEVKPVLEHIDAPLYPAEGDGQALGHEAPGAEVSGRATPLRSDRYRARSCETE